MADVYYTVAQHHPERDRDPWHWPIPGHLSFAAPRRARPEIVAAAAWDCWAAAILARLFAAPGS